MAAVSSLGEHFESYNYSRWTHTSHVRELFTTEFKIAAVLCLHRVSDSTRYGVVNAQDGGFGEFDFARRVAFEIDRNLSLPPLFTRASLTSFIWRLSLTMSRKRGRFSVACSRVPTGGSIIRLRMRKSSWTMIIIVRLGQSVTRY